VIVIGVSGLLISPTSAAMLLLRKRTSSPAVRSQVFTISSGMRSASGALGAGLAGIIAGLDSGVLITGVAIAWMLGGLVMIGYRQADELPDASA
jgi:hypothetical protein